MSEIWNLSTLCRCCHADGHFKSLALPYQGENNVEIYENMLQNVLGISMIPSPLSYTICDNCILNLRDAAAFKNQVLTCEQKFQVYLNNEQFVTNPGLVKIEQDNDEIYDNDDSDLNNECTIEVDIKHPIEDIKEEPFNEIIEETSSNEEKKDQKPDLTNNDTRDKQKCHKSTKKNPLNNEIIVEKSSNEVKTCHKSGGPKTTLKNGVRKKQNGTKNTKGSKSSENSSNLDCLYSLIPEAGSTGPKYSCKQCNKCYPNKKEMKRHIRTTHPVLYKCEFCSLESKCLFKFKAHVKTHTETIFECDLCSKQFKCKQVISRHLKMHAGTNKTKQCDLCGNLFNDKANLFAHIRSVHEKLRPHHCKLCNKTFTTKRFLRDHLKIHNGSVKLYECDVCDHKLICQKSMQIHRLKHDGKYMCKFCSQVFNSVEFRKEHILAEHRSLTELPCPLCGKILRDKSTLNRHIRLHDGVKKFSCYICDAKFTEKASLNRHIDRKHNIKVGSDIAKTKCDICKHSFKNIILHMACHNKRSSKCDVCGKTYPDNSSLNRHKSTKHFGRTFDCEICGKKYIYNSKLQTHRRKVHQIKIEKDSTEGS